MLDKFVASISGHLQIVEYINYLERKCSKDKLEELEEWFEFEATHYPESYKNDLHMFVRKEIDRRANKERWLKC